MKSKLEGIKKVKLEYILIIVLTLLFSVLFINEHFALDTYFFQNSGFDANQEVYLRSGRIIMYIFLGVTQFLHLSYFKVKLLSWLIGTFSLIIGSVVLDRLLEKLNKKINPVIRSILSTMIVVSPFVLELFIYTELTGVMCFGILSSVISAYFLYDYIENGKKRGIVKSLLFMLLAVCSYQGVVSIFIMLSTFLISRCSKNFKQFIRYNFVMLLVYGIPAMIDLIIVKLLGSARNNVSHNDLFETITKILDGLKKIMVNTSNMLPSYFFITIVAIMVALIIVSSLREKRYLKIFWSIYMIVFTIIFSLLPQFFVATASVWIVARSTIAISSLIGMLLTFYLYNFRLTEFKQILVISIMSLTIPLQYSCWDKLSIDHYLVNKLDQTYTVKIIEKIREYESTNHTNVEYLKLYNDANVSYLYESTNPIGDINIRVYAVDWARVDIISMYAGFKYKNAIDNSDFKTFCESKNWDEFNDEQLKFDGKNVYVCVY